MNEGHEFPVMLTQNHPDVGEYIRQTISTSILYRYVHVYISQIKRKAKCSNMKDLS